MRYDSSQSPQPIKGWLFFVQQRREPLLGNGLVLFPGKEIRRKRNKKKNGQDQKNNAHDLKGPFVSRKCDPIYGGIFFVRKVSEIFSGRLRDRFGFGRGIAKLVGHPYKYNQFLCLPIRPQPSSNHPATKCRPPIGVSITNQGIEKEKILPATITKRDPEKRTTPSTKQIPIHINCLCVNRSCADHSTNKANPCQSIYCTAVL